MNALVDGAAVNAIGRYRVAVVTTCAALVTTYVLSADLGRSFNFDESVNVEAVIQRGSAWTALSGTETFNNHPVFAVGQSVWWALGGDGESRQRILPILYGVAAVALVCWWTSRRFGVLAGAGAAAVMALNPMFIGQARSVRGYSLVVLCVVIATISLIEYLSDDDVRWLVPYTLAIIAAMGTHPFAGVPLGALSLAAVASRRRLDVELVAAWFVAAGGTVLVYLPSFDALRDSIGATGSRYIPWAGTTTLSELLGRDTVTEWLLAGVLVVSAVTVARRPDLRWPVVVLVGLVVGQFVLFWQVIRPWDFFPRFFLGVLPMIALGVGWAIRRVPALAGVVAVALMFTLGNVADERTRNVPIRETAAVVRSSTAAGLEPCIVGGGPIRLYAPPPRELTAVGPDAAAQLDDCDVFIRIGGWGRPLLAPARDRYLYEGRIDGQFEVFADVPLEQLDRSITVYDPS